MSLSISSSTFAEMGTIPTRYTCEGRGISPPLSFDNVPQTAKSLALIVDDPDAPDPAAPKMTWVHWVVYNIPPYVSGIEEDAGSPIEGAMEGKNSWKRGAYGGPCPPVGRHRYFFKLYALDAMLPDLHGPSEAELERAMQGHVIEKATLIGTYQKKH
jgi:Raf kinase inhibitor-like YbhB/YbcL family protein